MSGLINLDHTALLVKATELEAENAELKITLSQYQRDYKGIEIDDLPANLMVPAGFPLEQMG
jgi:hypothetical protein